MLAQIGAMHRTRASLETYAEVHGPTRPNWLEVAEDTGPFLSLGPTVRRRQLETALPWVARALGLPPPTSKGTV